MFFLLIGLELKRELRSGALSTWAQRVLPGARAGWAIPAATDIASALGVFALLGARVPPSLKALLTAIAVLDDLGAILVIAFVYTADLKAAPLLCAARPLAGLALLNRASVAALAPYSVAGARVLRGQLRCSYATAMACGIGFTMSLFIDGLAFGEESDAMALVKLGVLAGSLASALLAYALVRAGAGRRPT